MSKSIYLLYFNVSSSSSRSTIRQFSRDRLIFHHGTPFSQNSCGFLAKMMRTKACVQSNKILLDEKRRQQRADKPRKGVRDWGRDRETENDSRSREAKGKINKYEKWREYIADDAPYFRRPAHIPFWPTKTNSIIFYFRSRMLTKIVYNFISLLRFAFYLLPFVCVNSTEKRHCCCGWSDEDENAVHRHVVSAVIASCAHTFAGLFISRFASSFPLPFFVFCDSMRRKWW